MFRLLALSLSPTGGNRRFTSGSWENDLERGGCRLMVCCDLWGVGNRLYHRFFNCRPLLALQPLNPNLCCCLVTLSSMVTVLIDP